MRLAPCLKATVICTIFWAGKCNSELAILFALWYYFSVVAFLENADLMFINSYTKAYSYSININSDSLLPIIFQSCKWCSFEACP
jgi:hypothetical protein